MMSAAPQPSNASRTLQLAGAVRLAGAVLAAACALALAGGALQAHPGDLDEYGGHFDERTGTYHYHRPKMDMTYRKQEYLAWLSFPDKGVIKGTVARIERPGAVWLHIPYRPAFQELAAYISADNRDDERAQLRFWLRHISPAESAITRGGEYKQWFAEKVVYELRRKLADKTVTVQFEMLEPVRRPRGMVFLGEENINLWLVLNGWSYYVLDEPDNPYHELFMQAEDLARRDGVGLWQSAR